MNIKEEAALYNKSPSSSGVAALGIFIGVLLYLFARFLHYCLT